MSGEAGAADPARPVGACSATAVPVGSVGRAGARRARSSRRSATAPTTIRARAGSRHRTGEAVADRSVSAATRATTLSTRNAPRATRGRRTPTAPATTASSATVTMTPPIRTGLSFSPNVRIANSLSGRGVCVDGPVAHGQQRRGDAGQQGGERLRDGDGRGAGEQAGRTAEDPAAAGAAASALRGVRGVRHARGSVRRPGRMGPRARSRPVPGDRDPLRRLDGAGDTGGTQARGRRGSLGGESMRHERVRVCAGAVLSAVLVLVLCACGGSDTIRRAGASTSGSVPGGGSTSAGRRATAAGGDGGGGDGGTDAYAVADPGRLQPPLLPADVLVTSSRTIPDSVRGGGARCPGRRGRDAALAGLPVGQRPHAVGRRRGPGPVPPVHDRCSPRAPTTSGPGSRAARSRSTRRCPAGSSSRRATSTSARPPTHPRCTSAPTPRWSSRSPRS